MIGITNAGDGTDQNVNYAIPLEIVKGTIENIMYYKDNAKIITLGVEVLSSNSKYVFDAQKGSGEIVETLTLYSVAENSISQQLGLEKDDVLLSFIINGVEHKLNRTFNIGDLILTIRSGDEISFKISRAGQATNSLTYTVLESDLKPTV